MNARSPLPTAAMTRRYWLLRLPLAAAAVSHLHAQKPAPPAWPLGVNQGLDQAVAARAAGFDFMEGGVGAYLMPDKPDDVFAKALASAKEAPLPVVACNGFFRGSIRLVGDDAGHDAALAWARIALRRARQAGLETLVLGSSSARRVPDGFDPKRARDQFVEFCRKLGPLAADENIMVAIEPLNRTEDNFLTTLAAVIDIVDAIAHRNVQLNVDFYHMMKEDESPDVILRAGKRIAYCQLAEKEGRNAPGVKGEDLRPYWRALRDTGYTGRVSVESKWTKFSDQAATAVRTMREQISSL